MYLTYDPNYNYDDDTAELSDGEGGGVMETEEDGEEDAEDEYSDDDDMSWKVRRAATKCLEAVVSSRRELLAELYKVVSPALIARFKGEALGLVVFYFVGLRRFCKNLCKKVWRNLNGKWRYIVSGNVVGISGIKILLLICKH